MTRGHLDPALSQAIAAEAPVGLALITAPGTVTWANRAYFEATGRTPEILGHDYHTFAEGEGTWSAPVQAAVDAALAAHKSATFRDVRARHRSRPGGIYLDLDVRPLEDVAGGPARALLLVRDVTERVEEHERANLFYASFRSSTNPMQLTDAKGVMVDVNPAFESIYGYRREECIGRRPNLVRSRYTPPEVYEQMWRDLKDPLRGYWAGEILNRDRNGRERPVLLSITAVRGRAGEVTNYLGVAVDRSERREWELRVAHSDKLASVGQLAAGVAHEINTPLANVMLVAESLRRKSQDPWVLGRLDTLTEQVEVAARIVRSLLDFARRDEPHVAPLDLAEVVRSAAAFVRGKQADDIEILESYAPDPVPVSADRQQVIQVVTNILNNACDALDGHGRIRIHVERVGSQGEVEIIDSGPGISPEVLPHIFEPFFTTKPEGKGTGLGLAVCHGIMMSHHGFISAFNADGGGAGFRLAFPLRVDPPTVPPAAG